MNIDVKYDFTADLAGIGDESAYEICDILHMSGYLDTDIEVFHLRPLMLVELS